MTTITINELRPAGTMFFTDSESFLNDLSDDALADINGGATPAITYTVLRVVAHSSKACGAVVGAAAGAAGSAIYTMIIEVF